MQLGGNKEGISIEKDWSKSDWNLRAVDELIRSNADFSM